MNAKLSSLIFTSLSHLSVDGNILLFPILITYYLEIPGLSIVTIGLMPVLYNLISGFMSLFVGKYADKVDKDAAILGLAILLNGIALFIFLFPFLSNNQAYLFMVTGSVVLGVSQSVYHPIGATILSYTFGQKESASYLGINGSFGSLGRSFFPLILIFVASVIGIKLGLAVFTIYFIAIAITVFLGLKFFRRRNFRMGSIGGESKDTVKTTSKYVLSFILLLVVIVFLRSMFVLVTTTYIPTYLDNVFRSKELMGVVISVAFFSAVLGQPFFGVLTSKFGGKFTISITSVGLVVFFFTFLFLSRSFASILASFTLFALFTYTGFPVLLGYVSQVVPKENLTKANALVWGIGNTVGGSIGLMTFDRLLLIKNMFDSFVVMSMFAVVSAILLIFLPGKLKK